jgi:hypothetical protein
MKSFLQMSLSVAAALCLSGASLAYSAQSSASGRLRVDCRFYSTSSHFCYASAVYTADGPNLSDIRYGVGCDYETIYDDGGTSSPQDELSDGIRPATAALPRIEITPKFSLRHPGTYTAKLEIDRGKLTVGTCYVRWLDKVESDFDTLFMNWIMYTSYENGESHVN